MSVQSIKAASLVQQLPQFVPELEELCFDSVLQKVLENFCGGTHIEQDDDVFRLFYQPFVHKKRGLISHDVLIVGCFGSAALTTISHVRSVNHILNSTK